MVSLALAYLDGNAASLRCLGGTADRALIPCARRVGEWLPGLLITGCLSRRNKGLPGSWVIPFGHAMAENPVGLVPYAHYQGPHVAFTG